MLPNLGTKGTPTMDLQTLADRTKVPLRKLRYVLDHRLLPGLRVKHARERTGHPRSFEEFEGFGLAGAAALAEAGVRRETIVLFMDVICDLELELPSAQRIGRIALVAAFQEGADPAVGMVGDGALVRVKIKTLDTGWIAPKALAKVTDFAPRVIIQLDLALLRKAIRQPIRNR
jgi:hypothetical protein